MIVRAAVGLRRVALLLTRWSNSDDRDSFEILYLPKYIAQQCRLLVDLHTSHQSLVRRLISTQRFEAKPRSCPRQSRPASVQMTHSIGGRPAAGLIMPGYRQYTCTAIRRKWLGRWLGGFSSVVSVGLVALRRRIGSGWQYQPSFKCLVPPDNNALSTAAIRRSTRWNLQYVFDWRRWGLAICWQVALDCSISGLPVHTLAPPGSRIHSLHLYVGCNVPSIPTGPG